MDAISKFRLVHESLHAAGIAAGARQAAPPHGENGDGRGTPGQLRVYGRGHPQTGQGPGSFRVRAMVEKHKGKDALDGPVH